MAPSTRSKQQQSSYHIKVYCDGYLDDLWTGVFGNEDRMSRVVRSIWEDQLQEVLEQKGMSLSDLTIHVLKDGLLWDNPEGFRKRLERHIEKLGKSPDASLDKIRVSTVCAGHLAQPTKDTHVYFVIGITDGNKPELLRPQPQGEDVLGPLPTAEDIHKHALNYVRHAKHSPSHAAQLKIYAKRQEKEYAYHDGRYMNKNEKNTRGVPVALHSPSFALFQTLAEDRSFVPSAKFLHLTYQFMRTSSVIYLKEQERAEELSKLFSDIFGRSVLNLQIGRANPDGSVLFDLVWDEEENPVHETVPLAVIEFKVEPGSGGCDAGVQALAAVEQFWEDSMRSRAQGMWCCPTLAIAMDGPWLRVYGCIFTDRWICQPLAAVPYTGIASNLPIGDILSVARVFHALRMTMSDIESRAQAIVAASPRPPSFRPDMWPAPTRCGEYEIQYTSCPGLRRRLTYFAAIVSRGPRGAAKRRRVVVRFTEQYGKEQHELLAKKGMAPRLLYCGPPYPDIQAPDHAGLTMVVMEASPGTAPEKTVLFPTICAKVYAAIEELHKAGYVHGNVTTKTITYVPQAKDGDSKVHLLNFELAGEEGKSYYSVELPWLPENVPVPVGMSPLRPVTKKHDLHYLEHIFPRSDVDT